MTSDNSVELAIQSAYITLMQTESFERLTVSQLARTAHISRGTFYLHYPDKAAMRAHWSDTIVTNMTAVLHHQQVKLTPHHEQHLYTYATIRQVMVYATSRRAMLATLLGPHGDPGLEPTLKQIITRDIERSVTSLKGNARFTPKLPAGYANVLIISGIFDILRYWLSKPDPESVDAITKVIMDSRYLSPFDLLGVPQNPHNH